MSRIPLACADFSFPLLPHEATLDLIAAMEIRGVDISLMLGNSHLDVSRSVAKPQQEGVALKKKLHDRGLTAADVNFTPGRDFRTRAVNHPDPEIRQESRAWFQRALEFTAHIAAKHMTILPGIEWDGETRDRSYARCVEELAWRVEEGLRNGVIVSTEAHLGSIVPTPASAQQLLNDIPDLTLTLDYTHFVYQGFSDIECENLLPRASHFHARGAAKGKLQTTFKRNSIDYLRIVRRMNELKYKGYFAIEYVWIDWEGCNETDNVSESILLRNLVNQYGETCSGSMAK